MKNQIMILLVVSHLMCLKRCLSSQQERQSLPKNISDVLFDIEINRNGVATSLQEENNYEHQNMGQYSGQYSTFVQRQTMQSSNIGNYIRMTWNK